jgi:hypothetical protein
MTATEMMMDASKYWMMMALSSELCDETQALILNGDDSDVFKGDDSDDDNYDEEQLRRDEETFQRELAAYEASKATAARDAKWVQYKFGLCCDCDAGLDDESDFALITANDNDTLLRCNDCCRNPRFAYGHS